MNTLYNRKKPVKVVETLFNTAYIITAAICTALLLLANTPFKLWAAVCALCLVCGDTVHLMPRILAMWEKKNSYHRALAVGKLTASLTMTLFYIAALFAVNAYYGLGEWFTTVVIAAAVLAAARIVLSLLKQNRWFDSPPDYRFGIYRNIPFTALGLLTAAVYMYAAFSFGGFAGYIWVLILLSFAFYLPVVVLAAAKPKVGMLMLPKTVAYAVMLLVFVAV